MEGDAPRVWRIGTHLCISMVGTQRLCQAWKESINVSIGPAEQGCLSAKCFCYLLSQKCYWTQDINQKGFLCAHTSMVGFRPLVSSHCLTISLFICFLVTRMLFSTSQPFHNNADVWTIGRTLNGLHTLDTGRGIAKSWTWLRLTLTLFHLYNSFDSI